MKTKTLKTAISIFIAFSLALSSCDKKNAFLVNRRTATPEKIEEIKSINYLTTLVKDLADTANGVPSRAFAADALGRRRQGYQTCLRCCQSPCPC
ncbi:hypothetical protein AGMMS49593_07160 [Endomicrobiia bacterium]|nr:hypothetical protein AGMMS49593_07160 [Endomicrobiia bacterium]